jgi:hypothetical protein
MSDKYNNNEEPDSVLRSQEGSAPPPQQMSALQKRRAALEELDEANFSVSLESVLKGGSQKFDSSGDRLFLLPEF